MKGTISKQLFILFTTLLFLTSCSSESILKVGENPKASLTVKLAGTPLSRATKSVTLAEENAINKMVVLVFCDGNLEARKLIEGATGRITELSTGEKEVKVVVNPSDTTAVQLNSVATLEELQRVTLELTDEWGEQGEMAAKGLTMTGASTVTLQAGDENQTTIKIKRTVAKLILGNVVVELEPGYDPKEFELIEVYVKHVRSTSLLGFPNYLLEEDKGLFKYMGETATNKIPSEISIADARLKENFTPEGFSEAPYFYITPNNWVDKYINGGTATGIGVFAKYKGKYMGWFRHINNLKVEGYEEVTGDYIQPNRQYRVNFKITRPKGFDPLSGVEITVIPEEWEVVPNQNVVW